MTFQSTYLSPEVQQAPSALFEHLNGSPWHSTTCHTHWESFLIYPLGELCDKSIMNPISQMTKIRLIDPKSSHQVSGIFAWVSISGPLWRTNRAASLLEGGLLRLEKWSFCSPLTLWSHGGSIKTPSWWCNWWCTGMYVHILLLPWKSTHYKQYNREARKIQNGIDS